jgi:Na+/melibiose symporter-like transporter
MESLSTIDFISAMALAGFFYAPYEMQSRFRRRRPWLIGAGCSAVLVPFGAYIAHLEGWSFFTGALVTWIVGTAICAGIAGLAPSPKARTS